MKKLTIVTLLLMFLTISGLGQYNQNIVNEYNQINSLTLIEQRKVEFNTSDGCGCFWFYSCNGERYPPPGQS